MAISKKEMERRKKIGNRWYSWLGMPLLALYDVCEAASHSYPIPPVNWILDGISDGFLFFGHLACRQGMKYNPDLKGPRSIKYYSLIPGAIAVVGLTLSLLLSGPVAAFFLAAGALALSVNKVLLFGTTLAQAWKEYKQTDPKETHRLRFGKKVLQCLNNGLGFACSLCVSILAVAAVVAVFANPVGLMALMGAMAAIAVATAAVAVGSIVAGKVVDRQIKKTELTMRQAEKKGNAKKLGLKDLKDQETRPENTITKKVAQKNSDHNLMLLQEAEKKNKKISARTVNSFLKHAYEALSEASIKEMEEKKKADPLYQAVEYKVEYLKNLEKKDHHELSIFVPHLNPKTKTPDKKDIIKRSLNAAHTVEITLNAHPSDNAIFILLDNNKVFAPLVMDHYGDAQMVLKVFEAAKLTGVEVRLDPQDRELLANNPDPKIKAYFNTIENWKTAEFQEYVEKIVKVQGELRPLGQIPEELPRTEGLDLKY